jgi:hypothetical protein
MMETDLCGLFSSFTNNIGTSGSDFTIALGVACQMKRRTLNARGQAAFVFDDQQALDLTAAVAASGASIFTGGASQSILNGRSDGYLGDFLGDPCFYTNLTVTANTGEDVVGAYLTTAASPEYASLGMVLKWAPRMKQQSSVADIADYFAITAAYGVGMRYATTGVSLTTDA